MNLYGILFIVLGVVVFALLTGMAEPFSLIERSLSQVVEPVRENKLAYNTAVLILVVIGLSVAANWLFRGRNNGEEERDRLGNRIVDEAGPRITEEVPRQEAGRGRRGA